MWSVAHVGVMPAVPSAPVYCATKHGVVSFTRSMNERLTSDGVRVNCICPTFVDTAMVRVEILAKPDCDETLRAYVLDNIIRCVSKYCTNPTIEFQYHFTIL